MLGNKRVSLLVHVASVAVESFADFLAGLADILLLATGCAVDEVNDVRRTAVHGFSDVVGLSGHHTGKRRLCPQVALADKAAIGAGVVASWSCGLWVIGNLKFCWHEY